MINYITLALAKWLAKHNIPSEGVCIIIEFPNKQNAKIAEMCIKRDLDPAMRYHVRYGPFESIETTNGIRLSIRYDYDKAKNILNWLKRNANAEKEPKTRKAFIEAHNAALTIIENRD